MPHSITTPPSVDALLDGLHGSVDIVLTSMPDDVARLALASMSGTKPVLYLDLDSPPEDQCWAMLDALRVLTLGPNAALSARAVRHLRAVTS